MPRVIGKISGTSQEKRFYLPGVKVEDECPDCKKTVKWDGDTNYLSYPILGDDAKVDFHFYCGECDKEWEIGGSISITIKL